MASQIELWSSLQRVRSLRFDASSEAASGWNGIGTGSVEVTEPAADVLVFTESGTWQPKQDGNRSIRFTNTFRWSTLGQRIRLEHLRFGQNNPVFLFDLVEGESGEWRDQSPHLCSEDCYKALLRVEAGQLSVTWSVYGPKKQESIEYLYW